MVSFDQAYVIVIPARRSYILETLGQVGIHPIVFPGVLKDTLYVDSLVREGYATPDAIEKLGTARIACHLSHVAVLETFLASDAESCLIFEDDIAPPAPDVLDRIEAALEALPADWDILYLGRCHDSCGSDVPVGDTQIVRCMSPLCRHAYAVSRKGAETLVSHAFPMERPGDNMYADLIHAGELVAYCAKPALFHQNREYLGSTLGNHSKLVECYGPLGEALTSRHGRTLAVVTLLLVLLGVCVGMAAQRAAASRSGS